MQIERKGRMSKSVYVRVFHDLELLKYVLRCAIERQLSFPAGMSKVYGYCYEFMKAEVSGRELTFCCHKKSVLLT